jgi:hypothetical protein
MHPKKAIDRRPFQSRVDLERERALEAHYHRLAIPGLVAAVGLVAEAGRRAADRTTLDDESGAWPGGSR